MLRDFHRLESKFSYLVRPLKHLRQYKFHRLKFYSRWDHLKRKLWKSEFWLTRWRLVSVKTIGREIDFVGNCIAESTAFFYNYPTFISTPFIQIKIVENPFLALKKFVLEGRFPNLLFFDAFIFQANCRELIDRVKEWS